MVSLCLGRKPSGVPYVKVLKYDTDHPDTLSNTAYDRFLFNSENQKLSYVFDDWQFNNINDTNYPTNGTSGASYVLEGGAMGAATWGVFSTRVTSGSDADFRVFGMLSRFSSAPYVPFVDVRFIGYDGWTKLCDIKAPRRVQDGDAYSQMAFGLMNYVTPATSGAYSINSIPSGFGYAGWAVRVSDYGATVSLSFSGPVAGLVSMVWDLPSGADPMSTPSQTPASGVPVFTASPTRVAMARTGFNVDTANQSQLLFDSNKVPVKCVMYGETPYINAGSEYFVPNPTGFPLSPNMLIDAMLKAEGTGSFYQPPLFSREIGTSARAWIDYKIEAGGIRFRASGDFGFTVKYMLYSAGHEAVTTSGNQVMRTLADGNIQIKRPGSSDSSPNYRDIVLDTRIPTVQILAEQWVPISSFYKDPQLIGPAWYDIPYDDKNGSLFVFPKIVGSFGTVRRGPLDYGRLSEQVIQGQTITIKKSSRQSMRVGQGNGFFQVTLLPDVDSGEIPAVQGPEGIRYYILGVPY